MTMQITAEKFGKAGRIRIAVRKQDNYGNEMPVAPKTIPVNDKRMARVVIDALIQHNPRVGKVRIKWEV